MTTDTGRSTLEANKQVVQSFFELISAGKFDDAFALVSDDVTWWVPEELPFSGSKTKREYLEIVRKIQSGFPTGFELRVTSMIGEGTKVAAEVESRGTHVSGKSYANKYHFLIGLRDGRFASVKEYMNTLHLAKLMS